VRTLVPALQAQFSGSCRDNGGAGFVAGARPKEVPVGHDHPALGAALCAGVRQALEPFGRAHGTVVACRWNIPKDSRQVGVPLSGGGSSRPDSRLHPPRQTRRGCSKSIFQEGHRASWPTTENHRNIKSRTNVTLGFKRIGTASVTRAGIELMHRIRKGQFNVAGLHFKDSTRPEVWSAVISDR